MKIAVLVKQVPGGESALPMNSEQNWVDESSVTYVMNPPDNYAIEEALLIKEGLEDCLGAVWGRSWVVLGVVLGSFF